MLLCGVVGPGDALAVLADKWNVFLFFLGLMTIAVGAESAGFFDWAAALAGQWAKGQGLRLFINVFLLGTVISTFFSNDATALILTPVVYSLVTRLRLNPLPFMFACTFIADTASFVLPVSNPINILVLGQFPADLL
jgi:arsenical pump membrane protein